MAKDISFMWFEITGKCQLECQHCYAESGPHGVPGSMSRTDWITTIDDAADLGVAMVQFIGGEPTLHPDLPKFVRHALDRAVRVEIYSNLVYVPEMLWKVFSQPGVRLATSYYSDEAQQHEQITQRRGSYARTRTNIREALRRSIPLRVGVIEVRDSQRIERARAELAALGVTDVHVDRLRRVGRGANQEPSDVNELCGHCAQGVVAVSPTGEVWPCVFARWMPLGNVRTTPLMEILSGTLMASARTVLSKSDWGDVTAICDPRCCPNNMCDPQCSPSCSPSCTPAGNCVPTGNCAPNY
ncbi:MAG: radical SAM/SPASM domain-containing protein [Pseudonocardia sp.]